MKFFLLQYNLPCKVCCGKARDCGKSPLALREGLSEITQGPSTEDRSALGHFNSDVGCTQGFIDYCVAYFMDVDAAVDTCRTA